MGKKIINRALLVSLGIVIGIGLLELLLLIVSSYWYPRLTISDKTLGMKYISTKKKVNRNFSKDINYSIFINQEGFRDDEFKDSNNYFKIMVLGDSMTFGLEVDQENIFSKILEDSLRKNFGTKKIDVMNFAITGFSTAQEYLTLEKYGKKYDPKIVLLMMFENNDFEDNITSFGGGRFVPHFTLTNGELILNDSPTKFQKFLTFLRDHSIIFYFLSNKLDISIKMLTKSYNVSEERKIALMKEIVMKIDTYTNSNDLQLLIFYIKDPKILNKTRINEIRNLSRTLSIPFKEIPLINEERVNGVGHWNEKGHISVSKLILEELMNKRVK